MRKTNKFISVICVFFLVITLVLSGCSSSAPAGDSKSGQNETVSPEQQALIDQAKKEGKLVVYGGTPEPWLNEILAAFSKKYPFIDTSEYFRAGGNKLYTKLLTEIQAGQNRADIFASANTSDLVDFKKRDLLLEYKSPEGEAVFDNMKDPGWWYGYRITPISFAYNPNNLPENQAPKNWQDLLDPKYKGKIAFEDSGSGSQFTQWYAMKDILGEEYWEKLSKQEPKIYNSSGLIMQGLLTGEILVAGATEAWRLYQEGTLKGSPIKGVFAEEGVAGMVATVGIVKGAAHPAAAKLFVDWTLSEEGQRLCNAQILGGHSTRNGVEAPKGLPELSSFKLITATDNADFLANQPKFAADWSRLFETKK